VLLAADDLRLDGSVVAFEQHARERLGLPPS
jgi:hypothetical protein